MWRVSNFACDGINAMHMETIRLNYVAPFYSVSPVVGSSYDRRMTSLRQVLPYVNGTLYSLLGQPEIRARATKLGLGQILEYFMERGYVQTDRLTVAASTDCQWLTQGTTVMYKVSFNRLQLIFLPEYLCGYFCELIDYELFLITGCCHFDVWYDHGVWNYGGFIWKWSRDCFPTQRHVRLWRGHLQNFWAQDDFSRNVKSMGKWCIFI